MDGGPERWVDGSSQVSKALPVHLFQAEGAMLWWGGGLGVTRRDLGRCSPLWAGWGNSFELCCPSSGGQAAPAVSIWGPLLAPPLPG